MSALLPTALLPVTGHDAVHDALSCAQHPIAGVPGLEVFVDAVHFDSLARSLTDVPSRRRLLVGLSAVALAAMHGSESVVAKKKKRKKKLVLNAFGCVNVGGKCRGNSANCCSGICQGKKPKKGKKDKSSCLAHNALDCPIRADTCQEAVPCGTNGECFLTTGVASFCGFTPPSECVVCAKDVDCEALGFGEGAACVVCVGCDNEFETACVPAAV